MAATPPAPPAPTIPGYRDLAPLGRGGYSEVFRAYQERFDRWVAVKVLTFALTDDRSQRRFLRECQLAGRLSAHPNIVTVYDADLAPDGRPYISMELFDQGSIGDQLARGGPFPVDVALRVAIALAGALETAHRAGVVHRDVKPGNALLAAYGQPALTDFGLSILAERQELSVGVDALTPYHAAPEILERTSVSAAADIYSLASTTYAMLAGRAPHQQAGAGDSMASLLLRILQVDVPPIGRPDVPRSLDAALRGGLARDMAARTPTALAFAQALQLAQREIGAEVTEPVVFEVAGGAEGSGAASAAAPAGPMSPGATTVPGGSPGVTTPAPMVPGMLADLAPGFGTAPPAGDATVDRAHLPAARAVPPGGGPAPGAWPAGAAPASPGQPGTWQAGPAQPGAWAAAPGAAPPGSGPPGSGPPGARPADANGAAGSPAPPAGRSADGTPAWPTDPSAPAGHATGPGQPGAWPHDPGSQAGGGHPGAWPADAPGGPAQPGRWPADANASNGPEQPSAWPTEPGAHTGHTQPGAWPASADATAGAAQPGAWPADTNTPPGTGQPGTWPSDPGTPTGPSQPGTWPDEQGTPTGAGQPGGWPAEQGTPTGPGQPGGWPDEQGTPTGPGQPGGWQADAGAHGGHGQPGAWPAVPNAAGGASQAGAWPGDAGQFGAHGGGQGGGGQGGGATGWRPAGWQAGPDGGPVGPVDPQGGGAPGGPAGAGFGGAASAFAPAGGNGGASGFAPGGGDGGASGVYGGVPSGWPSAGAVDGEATVHRSQLRADRPAPLASPPPKRSRAKAVLVTLGVLALVAGAGAGGMLLLGGDDDDPPADGPEPGDDTEATATTAANGTQADVPTGLVATESEAGVNLDWEGDDAVDYVVLVLSEADPPNLVPVTSGSAHLIEATAVLPDVGYCYSVARLDTVDAIPEEEASDAFSPPVCIRGAAHDTVRTE